MRYLLVVLMLSLMAAGQAQDAASLASKVDKTDSRLTDARTPTTHTHTKAQITDLGAVGGGLESGLIVFSIAACPSGYTELASYDGLYLILTKAANGDAGTQVGSNSYTPQGTVSSTFSGSQVTTSAVSAGTPAGTIPAHTGTQKFSTSSSGTVALTGTATNVFTGTALGTHTHTDTAAGTVSSTFTGTQATIQPAAIKLIPCQKN